MSGTDTLKAINDLKAKIAALPFKTMAAKLRPVMPEIDQRIGQGVQHEEILSMLNSCGFDLKLTTFRMYLYRYRKKVAEGKKQPNRPMPVTASSSVSKEGPVGKPADSLIPSITNRGELAKIRSADFDLDQLAEIGKMKE